MPVGVALMAVAMVSIGLGNSIAFMYIGTTIAGIGFSFVMPSIFMNLGAAVHPSQMPTASGIVMASMNVGGFLFSLLCLLAGIMGVDMTITIKFPFMRIDDCLRSYWHSVAVYKAKTTKCSATGIETSINKRAVHP